MFRTSVLAVATAATLFTLLPVLAHDGAVGIVKERMKLMKFMGQNTKQIAPYAMGALDMNLKAVEGAAINISIAATNAIAQFPEHCDLFFSSLVFLIYRRIVQREERVRPGRLYPDIAIRHRPVVALQH